MEDRHASPDSRISDTEMMRATVSITRRTRQLLDVNASPRLSPPSGDRHSCGWDAGAALRTERATDVGAGLFDAVSVMMTAPDRRLPDGRTLREFAPGAVQLAVFADHVHGLTGQWRVLAGQVGMQVVLLLLAGHAATSSRRWWLGSDWPYLVAEFITRLKDPRRWRDPAMLAHLRELTPPPQSTDRDHLHELLLAGPDRLDPDTARYCLRAGIGHLLPHDYGRPPRPRHVLPPGLLALIEPAPPGQVPRH